MKIPMVLVFVAATLVPACSTVECSAVYYATPASARLEGPSAPETSIPPDRLVGATVTACHLAACSTATISALDTDVALVGDVGGSVIAQADPQLLSVEAAVEFAGNPPPDHYTLRIVAADGSVLLDRTYDATYYDPEESATCGAPYQARITPQT